MAGELDAKLWSELPGEILNLVLRRLPFSSLCRFRAVSKHWNTLPTVGPEDSYLLVIPQDLSPSRLRHCSLYNPITDKWDVLDLSFLPSRMTQLCSLPYAWPSQMERFCSDGGLLCLRGRFLDRALGPVPEAPPHLSLFVCNPLTRSCKLLPSFSFESQTCIDLVMHRENSGGYKIFAVTLAYEGQPGLLLRHFMYDSASESWKLLLDLNRDCSDVYILRYCSVVFEGVYYCVSGGGRQADEIYAYDIEQDSWLAAGVKMKLDPRTTQVLFVVSNGRLLLIASVFEEKSWFFRISRVDLCRMDDLIESVGLPANFAWNRSASALAYRDSILLASSPKFMAVVHLRSDLKVLKPITVMPNSERYKYGMAKASFDAQATV